MSLGDRLGFTEVGNPPADLTPDELDRLRRLDAAWDAWRNRGDPTILIELDVLPVQTPITPAGSVV